MQVFYSLRENISWMMILSGIFCFTTYNNLCLARKFKKYHDRNKLKCGEFYIILKKRADYYQNIEGAYHIILQLLKRFLFPLWRSFKVRIKYLIIILCFCLFVLSGCTSSNRDIATDQTTSYKATQYVEVKYRNTPVDLSSSAFEFLNTDISSFINGAWYDQTNQYMVIRLSGTYYHYCSLPNSIWNRFKVADSYGTFYNQHIKGNYDCRSANIPEY